jgi:hypothetical protein
LAGLPLPDAAVVGACSSDACGAMVSVELSAADGSAD